jgi:hypothetical protein
MVIGPEDFNTRSSIQLTCQGSDCCYEWEFTVGEQDWYDQKGFQYPKYCHACKAERKHNQGQQKRTQYKDIIIRCRDCDHDFTWLPRDQAFFAKQNPPFPPPQRCTGCKQARNKRFRQ